MTKIINNNLIFITIICVIYILIFIFVDLKYELFNVEPNLFFKPIKNIFLSDDYYNYKLNKPEINKNVETIGKITFDTYLYSKPTSQKIICSSHKNRGDCWEDNVNNCQWIHRIDGGSYCDVGQNIWP